MRVTLSSNGYLTFWLVHLELRYGAFRLFAFVQRRIYGSNPLHEPGGDLEPLRKYACILYHPMPRWDYPRPCAPEKARERYYLSFLLGRREEDGP